MWESALLRRKKPVSEKATFIGMWPYQSMAT
jgi:hypothetical protein